MFILSEHLIKINNYKHRNILTKLRLGILHLEIEKGRWHKIPRNNRICKMCNLNCIENEYHFTLVCPFYSNIRYNLLPQLYCINPCYFKFYHILSTTNIQLLENFAKYIYDSFETRQYYNLRQLYHFQL